MSNSWKSLPRRTFLRGVGAAVALPLLDAMSPALAATPAPPRRLAFLYVPNGIDMASWNVAEDGPLAELPRVLKPLTPAERTSLIDMLVRVLEANDAYAKPGNGRRKPRKAPDLVT